MNLFRISHFDLYYLYSNSNIRNKISKLNAMAGHNLHFSFEENEHHIDLRGSGPNGEHFGIFEPTVFFEDYTDKENAYAAMDALITMLLAGTTLTDPATYHNQCCNQKR